MNMTSITYEELFKSQFEQLEVPAHTEQMGLLEAALAWAGAGFFVLPINQLSKHAGSVLGSGWPEKSSRDITQIREWFSNGNHGLALHVGKSGAIVFDVDKPELAPLCLLDWMNFEDVPFQSTRVNGSLRGHYLFAAPRGKMFGNSTGRLGNEWGEVRGQNGIIVLSPTRHAKESEGGKYVWKRVGRVPYLPVDLETRLPEKFKSSIEAVDLAGVELFLATHTQSLAPIFLDQRVSAAKSQFKVGSRHNTARNLLVACFRESVAGLYPAKEALEAILAVFQRYKPRSEWTSHDEFVGMARWAIAQATSTEASEIEQIRESALAVTSPAIQNWIRGKND